MRSTVAVRGAAKGVMATSATSGSGTLGTKLGNEARKRSWETRLNETDGRSFAGSRGITLFQALKVTGPAPERINGRLAMTMFGPMVLREMETSETVLQQFVHPDWRLAAVVMLVVYASMVPVLAGCKDEDFGFMSVRAEKVNGRVAMLAWAAVILAEEVVGRGGVCFF
jgi:hypothetical protein